MRFQVLGLTTALIATAALSVSASSALTNGASDSTVKNTAIALAPLAEIQPDEAARFAKQASFGPTLELINEIVARKSIESWLDEQFRRSDSTYADLATNTIPGDYCQKLTGIEYNNCYRDNFTATRVQMRFYANAIGQEDQVRQRVAFALSQILVASESDIHTTFGLATYEQVLLSGSFGNYRDLLKAVTLNPFMGRYLNMLDSDKTSPNENYARELMQLFSVGTVLLNPDGTQQLDGSGTPIPAYSNADVREAARALTGWSYARLSGPGLRDDNNHDFSRPMAPNAARFDAGSKTFLGRKIPAELNQEANVDAIIDAVFTHPNTAPFVSKRLIQQLTVANPTPAYVGRVAAVFADNGAGVSGDMKAVIRAIYLDSEARTVSQLPGKVKEPVLLATSLARAIGYKTDGYAFATRDAGMGQAPFRAPSVFNFYSYEFPLPQGAGMVSPVSKLMTTSLNVARHNFIYDWTIEGDYARTEFKPALTSIGTAPNWASWEASGTSDDKTLDRINLVMLNGTMTPVQRSALRSMMTAIKNPEPATQARRRAVNAIYVVASSPLFQVDR